MKAQNNGLLAVALIGGLCGFLNVRISVVQGLAYLYELQHRARAIAMDRIYADTDGADLS